MRQRLTAAGNRGLYVAVMLFEGWEAQFTEDWIYHPFHRANNINGIEADADGDGKAIEYTMIVHTPMGRKVLELQHAYIRKAIDTVNDLDNVLYEIANESAPQSTSWLEPIIQPPITVNPPLKRNIALDYRGFVILNNKKMDFMLNGGRFHLIEEARA